MWDKHLGRRCLLPQQILAASPAPTLFKLEVGKLLPFRRVNILGSAGHTVSVATTQLCSVKAAIHKTYTMFFKNTKLHGERDLAYGPEFTNQWSNLSMPSLRRSGFPPTSLPLHQLHGTGPLALPRSHPLPFLMTDS